MFEAVIRSGKSNGAGTKPESHADCAADAQDRLCASGCGRKLGRVNSSGYCRRCHPIATSPKGSEARKRTIIKRTETILGWCPPPYRDLYRSMVRKTKHSPTARRAIEDQIAVERKRMLGGKLPDMKTFARAKAALKWEKERT